MSKGCPILSQSPRPLKYRANGEGCFRDDLNVTQSNGKDYSCNLVTGDKCQISPMSLEMLGRGHSLMLKVSNPNLGNGDSGAGIICNDPDGREHLLGVYVRSHDNGIVGVPLKSDFIKSFLDVESTQRHLQPFGLTLEPKYAEMYEFFDIFRNLERFGKSSLGPIDEPHYFESRKKVPPPKYYEIFIQFRDWVNNNPEEAERLFRENQIGLIDHGFDLKLSHEDFFGRIYPYKVLIIDWRVEFKDVVELLRK